MYAPVDTHMYKSTCICVLEDIKEINTACLTHYFPFIIVNVNHDFTITIWEAKSKMKNMKL